MKRTIDMTTGGIAKPLILFTLPMIGSSVFQQFYNTVDFLFVGNLLDKTAAAAVGASSTLISCVVGMFVGISVGTSVVCAQAVGSGDGDRADRAFHSSVTFGVICGCVLALAVIILGPMVLSRLNTPAAAMDQAVVYLRIYLLSVPALVFYNMCSGAMRAVGDSQTPFRILVICGIINILGDAFFMMVIPLGVTGVAIATVFSQICSAIFCVIYLNRRGSAFKLSVSRLAIDGKVLKQVLKIGLPSGIQTVIITFSNVMVQYYINDFGETAVAAFATYYKVENFIYFPAIAFGQACTTFAGQNFGAHHYRRIRWGTIVAAAMGAGITFLIAGAILLFPQTVFGWFMKDGSVVTVALEIAFVSFPFYWIYPIMESVGGSLRGMGYSLSSMVIIILNLCVLRVGMLAVFSARVHTIPSLAAVYPLTWASAAMCFSVVFGIVIRKRMKEVPV